MPVARFSFITKSNYGTAVLQCRGPNGWRGGNGNLGSSNTQDGLRIFLLVVLHHCHATHLVFRPSLVPTACTHYLGLGARRARRTDRPLAPLLLSECSQSEPPSSARGAGVSLVVAVVVGSLEHGVQRALASSSSCSSFSSKRASRR